MPQNNLAQNQSQITCQTPPSSLNYPAMQSCASQEGLINAPSMNQPFSQYISQQNGGNEVQKSPHPVTIKCPQCNQISKTNVTSQAGNGTLAWSFMLCLFTNACCIPFWINGCKDNVHSCSNCSTVVGINKYNIF